MDDITYVNFNATKKTKDALERLIQHMNCHVDWVMTRLISTWLYPPDDMEYGQFEVIHDKCDKNDKQFCIHTKLYSEFYAACRTRNVSTTTMIDILINEADKKISPKPANINNQWTLTTAQMRKVIEIMNDDERTLNLIIKSVMS